MSSAKRAQFKKMSEDGHNEIIKVMHGKTDIKEHVRNNQVN